MRGNRRVKILDNKRLNLDIYSFPIYLRKQFTEKLRTIATVYGWRYSYVVEHLPCVLQVQNSIPSLQNERKCSMV